MEFKKKTAEPGRLSRVEAAEWLGKNLKIIKRTIKNRRGIYPLDPDAIFKGFIDRISEEDYKVIRGLPRQGNLETHIGERLKDFMITRSYFHLQQEDFIQKAVTKLLADMHSSLSPGSEIAEFVTEELEKNQLERIKKFKEDSKLTTFLFPVIRNLILTYFRKQKKEAAIVRYEPSETIDRIFKAEVSTPEMHIIESDEKEIKKKIAELLPRKVEGLDVKEKVAFKMFYLADVPNYCEIARVLGTSRFKAKKITQKAWGKILTGIKKEIMQFFFKSKKTDV